MIPDFGKLDHGEIIPVGYWRVNCHMIFDIKMEDLRCKAGLVAVVHVIEPPETIA